IDKYVTFFDYDKYRKELVVSKEWNELLKETIDVDFSMEPKEVSFEKSYRWMNYQGGRVLKKLRLYGEYTGEDLIEKIIENAELSDEDEMQVEQATTDSANIVVLEGIGYLNRETGQIFGGSYG
ncbi:replication initiation factor domain-containing protein, partial [Enterococcus casseliflavus]